MRRPLILLALVALCHCGDDSSPSPTPAPPVQDAAAEAAPPPDGSADVQGDAPLTPDLSFATFNLRLFFDTNCDSGKCASGDFESVRTQAEFDARAEQVASAIRAMKVTAISLQEIENQNGLVAIHQRLSDLYPTAYMGEIGIDGSLDVAVLGPGPVLEIRKHRGVPIQRPDGTSTYFTREFLEMHLDHAGTRLVVFSAHFRSKNDDDPGRRIAEARAARDIVAATAQEFPQAVVLLGGDLNDTPGSEPLNEIESSTELLRVASDRPIEEVSTYVFGGDLYAIDHIFVAVNTRGAYLPSSAKAVRDAPGKGLAGSDHAALRADFYLK